MENIIIDDGNTGEAIAGALLSLIFNGETQKETLKGEGIGAIDLQLKYPIYYPVKTHRQVAIQVKTGNSFARWNKTKFHFVLQNIDKGHIEKWRATSQPVLLIWVQPGKRQANFYWKFFGSKTSLTILNLFEGHKLTPSARFEIDRLVTLSLSKKGGVPPINLKPLVKISEIREWARKRYKRTRGICDCSLGKVKITLYAWRHLTRESRHHSHIQDSLLLLPYVRTFLDKIPHQIQTISEEKPEKEFDNFIRIKRKVLAIFRNVKFSDKANPCVVYVRFEEIIIYPKNWRDNFVLKDSVQQSLKLESIYRKTT